MTRERQAGRLQIWHSGWKDPITKEQYELYCPLHQSEQGERVHIHCHHDTGGLLEEGQGLAYYTDKLEDVVIPQQYLIAVEGSLTLDQGRS